MTSLDAQTTQFCQCIKTKGAEENEGELGTAVICSDCHLEEANIHKSNDTEQAVLPDESKVYFAFKDSPRLKKIARRHSSQWSYQSINKVITKRRTTCQSVEDLVLEYGSAILIASLKELLIEEVFTSCNAAKRRFPSLFPDDPLPGSDEAHGMTTELPAATEDQPSYSEYKSTQYMTEGPDSKHITADKGGYITY